VACDLVYNPVQTEFLRRAGEAGATVMGGLGMLLHQGALAFELWTGKAAPLEAMGKALVKTVWK
jgi:shikimate dehydrogenase